MIVKEISKLDSGIKVENHSIWDDMIKCCEKSDGILWSKEYENIEFEDYFQIWDNQFKKLTSLKISAITEILTILGIHFKKIKISAASGGNVLYKLSSHDIIKVMDGKTNKDIILAEGDEGQVLRALNYLWITRYVFLNKIYNIHSYKRILKNYSMDSTNFLLNLIDFREDPGAVSIGELPRFLGFMG